MEKTIQNTVKTNISVCLTTIAKQKENEWIALREIYLPFALPNSIWCYGQPAAQQDLGQGWKIHLSATVLTVSEILRKIAPWLKSVQVKFKAPCSLVELMKINAGIFYGYSQIGKIITIYPRTDAEALRIAEELHQYTRRRRAPIVPFDFRYKPNSSVYYRYGSFQPTKIKNSYQDKQESAVLQTPSGNWIPDCRNSAVENPSWVVNPFPLAPLDSKISTINPFQSSYKVFRALTQRGKGGVFQALDLKNNVPRTCLVKEGRRNGETAWNGCDGFRRIQNEARVMAALEKKGIAVPRLYDTFRLKENFYLVSEYIEGETLEDLINRRKKAFSFNQILNFGIELANIIAQIHAAGWVWRDCKPSNIIVTPNKNLRPIDFEGACRVDCFEPLAWMTPPFAPPEIFADPIGYKSHLPEDLFALGITLYLLGGGKLPAVNSESATLKFHKTNLSNEFKLIVGDLLAADPLRRPSAQAVAERLKMIRM
ncbi:MAG: serine/threonine protein kinase [Acidobacteriota bacterium]|nr:serine/threonine protein kinase [Acidobacteriota bacterium]